MELIIFLPLSEKINLRELCKCSVEHLENIRIHYHQTLKRCRANSILVIQCEATQFSLIGPLLFCAPYVLLRWKALPINHFCVPIRCLTGNRLNGNIPDGIKGRQSRTYVFHPASWVNFAWDLMSIFCYLLPLFLSTQPYIGKVVHMHTHELPCTNTFISDLYGVWLLILFLLFASLYLQWVKEMFSLEKLLTTC